MAINRTFRPTARLLVAALSASLSASILVACGGVTFGGADDRQPKALNVALAGTSAAKIRMHASGGVVMTETLRRLEDVTSPDRRIALLDEDGITAAHYQAPAGWSLIDFALHPSREISLVLATNTALRLLRLDAQGRVLSQGDFIDPRVETDPFIGDPTVIRNPRSMLPFATRDAVRLAPLGEDTVVALRTGRNAVIAYRLRHSSGNGFSSLWRTLVEPGVPIGGIGLTSGTFDPFNGLDNQWKVSLDVNPNGQIAVAVALGLTELAEGHMLHFREPIDSAIVHGALVTHMSDTGQRLTTTVFDTSKKSEIHSVRWFNGSIAVGGRVLTERKADGTGWDAFVGLVHPQSRRVQAFNTIDVERGEVVLDMAEMSTDRLLVAGAAGYTQNPAGGSISEEANPLLVVADGQGRLVRRIQMAPGPRHNQVRSIATYGQDWVAAGHQNGPGTHSADQNPALLKADGFVRQMSVGR